MTIAQIDILVWNVFLDIYRTFACSFATDIQAKLFSVVGSDDAVNVEIGRGIDHHQNLRNVAEINRPNWKTS